MRILINRLHDDAIFLSKKQASHASISAVDWARARDIFGQIRYESVVIRSVDKLSDQRLSKAPKLSSSQLTQNSGVARCDITSPDDALSHEAALGKGAISDRDRYSTGSFGLLRVCVVASDRVVLTKICCTQFVQFPMAHRAVEFVGIDSRVWNYLYCDLAADDACITNLESIRIQVR